MEPIINAPAESETSRERQMTRDLAFYRTISQISKRFVATSKESFDADINNMVSRIGRHFKVSRSYLFLFENNNLIAKNTHEWCAEGVEPQMANLQDLPTAACPWWFNLILSRNIVHIFDVDHLPPEASIEKQLLKAQDIVSLICAPVESAERVWGFIGFDAVGQHYKWNEFEIDGLQTVANIVGDLLQRRFQEDEQNRLKLRLVQSSKMASIGILAAGVAHEIRNPLAIAKGFFDLLKSDLEGRSDVAAKIGSKMAKIDKSLDRITDIVSSLQQFAGGNARSSESVDFHEVIQEAVSICKGLYQEAGIDIKMNLAATDSTIQANALQLRLVIVNLLANAKDAILAHKESGLITIESAIDKDLLIVTVTDDGIGISPEHINSVFDPFFTTKDPGKGSGLGLSVARSFVDSLSGALTVQSEVGQGARLSISIPLGSKPSQA